MRISPSFPAKRFWLPAALSLLLAAAATPSALADLNPQEQAVANLLVNAPGQQRPPPMKLDPILSAVARARAVDMATRNYFDHVNPDGVAANYLVRQAGYPLPDWWGTNPTDNYIESIGAGYTSAADVWQAWMNSPPHHDHLLATNSFYANQTSYGIGYAYSANSTYGAYWVVITAPPPPAPADAATFVSQKIPATMAAGSRYVITVVMQNTGTNTWIPSSYQLGAVNPVNNTTWKLSRATLTTSVAPGAKATFTAAITAPVTPGTYACQWQMVRNNSTWFGDTSLDTNVTSSRATDNNAAFVSQVVPLTMSVGGSYNTSVTMRNTGVSTWTKGALFELDAADLTWGRNRISLPALPTSVPPGGSVTFPVPVKAPATPGTYTYQWRMIQTGIGWFGPYSTSLQISVK